MVARFEAERQALAMMDHPNIANVFDAGTTETGVPTSSWNWSWDTYHRVLRQEQADDPRTAELFIDVCHAIQHAHQKAIIHRDIKPTNVLVTLTRRTTGPKGH